MAEGLHLIELGQSPYSSPVYLQPPLMLLPFLLIRKFVAPLFATILPLVERWDMWIYRFLYIAVDIAIAHILHQIAGLAQRKYFVKWATLNKRSAVVERASSTTTTTTGSESAGNGIERNLPLFIAAW